MKRFLFILAALLFANTLLSQNSESRLHVRKLELVPNDTEASRAKKKDANGDKCALFKIQTPNMDAAERNQLVIEADRGTFIYPVNAVGELKIFLTEGVKILVFRHPDYGVLNYNVTANIEGNMVYKLVLEVDEEEPGPKPISINSNWVVVKMKPSDAIVTIDGKFCNNGKAMLSTDEPHILVATHPFYHTLEKTINASANEKMTYSFEMAPAFGWLNITSKPENGATVLINNRRVGVTPYRSDTLASGEYEVTLLKDMYESVTKTVTVRDNNVGTVEIPMKATFAEIKITTDTESDIYVDDSKRGTGTWTGRLGEGEHIVEARKTSHRNSMKRIEVVAGKNESVVVANPVPIYGALNVNTNPDEAIVYLDGVKIGETPMIKNNVLIGEHSLRFEKQGCAPLTKTVTVVENQMLNVDEKLVTGKEIAISTDGNGDKIFVDGNYIGVSPITSTLSFGNHEVTAIRGYNGSVNALKGSGTDALNAIKEIIGVKAATKTVTVSQSGGDTSVKLTFSDNRTFTVNGVTFEMVYVKGGTFTMGCTSEQGGDCYDIEKPSHSVTLSDYYIGKFEVTQELWRAVMRDKPIYNGGWTNKHGKGNNYPAYRVSWNDVQEFIRKLNQKTGANFRLPTEAEWEYAARGGNKSNGYKYSGSNTSDNVAWYDDNSGSKTHPVGTKSPNELGIYDMSGNVWECCQDWYGSYSSGSQTNPIGPSSGSSRVLRGGSSHSSARNCRVSNRSFSNPDNRTYTFGFRLSLSASTIAENSTITEATTSADVNGVFSVSATKKVYFSKGNLQYQASTNTWRFAEHQWDMIGKGNKNISSNYSGWIDLFGWGTSGYNDKNPYMISTTSPDYGNGNSNIAGTNYDWGVNNTISNGGWKQWRTLTKDEWVYVFNTRNTSSGIRYAKAIVNGINGVILLPDNWSRSTYSLNNTNKSDANFNSNNITHSDWTSKLEANGAVFLPAAGHRSAADVSDIGSLGGYWSATYGISNDAFRLMFSDSYLTTYHCSLRYWGHSVRLVCATQ